MDVELLATPVELNKSQGMSKEIRARIACSTWMCRSWTFQEGQLPPSIVIQFLNRAMILGRASVEDGRYLERARSVQQSMTEPSMESTQTPIDEDRSTHQGIELTVSQARPDQCQREQEEDKCNCIDIDLQRTFYSTFFEGSIDTDSGSTKINSSSRVAHFVTVWNELGGRSTTQPNDIPLMVANILDFETQDLHQHKGAEEMFLRIILSLGVVPLTIFFNTGPRQDQSGSHQNRWVPLKISTSTLTSDHLLR